MKFSISLQDRQTGKITNVWIEAKNLSEAKAIAMRDYGIAYIVR
ncbi:hypothetical protein STFE110948_05870 [Streptobacillus felis]|nr:hypothetical protein [Streptobacillus felis]